MNDKTRAYYTHKEQLCANGYDVVPTKGKRPFTKGWQKHDFCSDPAPTRRNTQNIGIKTGAVVAIDIDIMDAGVVTGLVDCAEGMLGWAPERVGKPPKVLLMYATDKPLKKLILKGEDGEQVEVLGQGQQFVALGTHPDTGKPYTWDEDPLAVPYHELTHVSEEQIHAYLDQCAKLMGVDVSAVGGGEHTDSAGVTTTVPDDDPLLGELHAGGFALHNAEPGKWNGDCPFGDHHDNGKTDGFVYWQSGYQGNPDPSCHCSHASCAGVDLVEVEEAVGVHAPLVSGISNLAEALNKHKPVPDSLEAVPNFVNVNILPSPEMQGPANARRAATKQPATYRNVLAVLDMIGGEVKYNELTKVEEVYLPWLSSTKGYNLNVAYSHLFAACQYAGMQSGNVVKEMVDVIALKNKYHPFREYLQGVEWDGVDRFGELAATIKVAHEHEAPILEVYLRRFLIQICEGVLAATPGQLRGLLLLCGEQGIGKTYWLSKLVGEEYFRDGVSVSSSVTGERDFLMASNGHVLVELGELDATFRKADVAHLKALLTRQTDTFRAPYAAKVQTYPRRVAYCGSVNDTEVLVDPTGNTRFWPIEVVALDTYHKVDMSQVWAQAVSLWEAGEDWQLAPEEEEMRAAGERKYRSLSIAEIKVDDHFTEEMMVSDKDKWIALNCTDVCHMLDIHIDKKTLNEMGHALRHLTGSKSSGARRLQGKKKAWLLPIRENNRHLFLAINNSSKKS